MRSKTFCCTISLAAQYPSRSGFETQWSSFHQISSKCSWILLRLVSKQTVARLTIDFARLPSLSGRRSLERHIPEQRNTELNLRIAIAEWVPNECRMSAECGNEIRLFLFFVNASKLHYSSSHRLEVTAVSRVWCIKKSTRSRKKYTAKYEVSPKLCSMKSNRFWPRRLCNRSNAQLPAATSEHVGVLQRIHAFDEAIWSKNPFLCFTMVFFNLWLQPPAPLLIGLLSRSPWPPGVCESPGMSTMWRLYVLEWMIKG